MALGDQAFLWILLIAVCPVSSTTVTPTGGNCHQEKDTWKSVAIALGVACVFNSTTLIVQCYLNRKKKIQEKEYQKRHGSTKSRASRHRQRGHRNGTLTHNVTQRQEKPPAPPLYHTADQCPDTHHVPPRDSTNRNAHAQNETPPTYATVVKEPRAGQQAASCDPGKYVYAQVDKSHKILPQATPYGSVNPSAPGWANEQDDETVLVKNPVYSVI